MRLIIPLILALTGIILIFYLSWLPQPKLGQTWFIPDWLGTWADAENNATIRTSIPFIFLGILTGAWLQSTATPWYKWLVWWFGLVSVVIIAEAGQFFLPYRSFDLRDIAWGITGSFVGLTVSSISWSTGKLLNDLINRKRKFNVRNP